MGWYYNKESGAVAQYTGWQEVAMKAEITAEKLVPATEVFFGPFATQQEAQNFKNANPSVVDKATQAIQAPVTDVTSAVAGAVNTLVKLSVRLAEAAVGIVLLAIAFNAILKQTTGVDAVGSARKAGKTAAKAASAAAVL